MVACSRVSSAGPYDNASRAIAATRLWPVGRKGRHAFEAGGCVRGMLSRPLRRTDLCWPRRFGGLRVPRGYHCAAVPPSGHHRQVVWHHVERCTPDNAGECWLSPLLSRGRPVQEATRLCQVSLRRALTCNNLVPMHRPAFSRRLPARSRPLPGSCAGYRRVCSPIRRCRRPSERRP